jgi:hypothetical protein
VLENKQLPDYELTSEEQEQSDEMFDKMVTMTRMYNAKFGFD